MSVTIKNVGAGDIVIYKSFDGKTTDYLVISKTTCEHYVENTKEVSSKGSLVAKTVENNITKYNNFYCLADGTFPNLILVPQSNQE